MTRHDHGCRGQTLGRTIGAVSLADEAEVAAFEYEPAFTRSAIEVAPLTMPLADRVYTFPHLSRRNLSRAPRSAGGFVAGPVRQRPDRRLAGHPGPDAVKTGTLPSFLGQWSLAPAFDLIYSYNPFGTWTASHQMTLNGKRDNFTLEDFNACAKTAAMKRGRAEAIVGEVRETILRWQDYAEEVGVPAAWREQIQSTLRL